MNSEFELIICIVNQGFSEEVMQAAKECGARGGTVINARGTAKAEAEEQFHISINPEKEIVLILSKIEIKDAILHAIYTKVGLNSPGQGIAFSTPVDDVVGIGEKNIKKLIEQEKENK